MALLAYPVHEMKSWLGVRKRMIALEVEDERVTRVMNCRHIGHGEFVTESSISMQNAGATQDDFHAYLTRELGVPEKAYQKAVIPVLAEKAPRTFSSP